MPPVNSSRGLSHGAPAWDKYTDAVPPALVLSGMRQKLVIVLLLLLALEFQILAMWQFDGLHQVAD